MSDEILQLKPNLYGVGIDLKVFWRRLTGKNSPGPLEVVAQRFLQVFLEHGVAVAQIPRLIPELSLDVLRSPNTLLSALNTDILDRTAKLFGVRVAWLEGVEDRLFEYRSCYKDPSEFIRELVALQARRSFVPIRIYTSADRLDYKKSTPQNLILVMAEEVAQIGEEIIERFHIYDDLWDWPYRPCRIQLKAMARLAYKTFRKPLPIYRVSHADLLTIGEGRRVPKALTRGGLITNPSLEDYALAADESAQAKEVEELPEVLAYIEREGLNKLVETR